jgi:hypothetical protein
VSTVENVNLGVSAGMPRPGVMRHGMKSYKPTAGQGAMKVKRLITKSQATGETDAYQKALAWFEEKNIAVEVEGSVAANPLARSKMVSLKGNLFTRKTVVRVPGGVTFTFTPGG